MVIDVLTLPAAFVAVTVYEAEAVSSWGVPLILPFCAFKIRPIGSAGATVHDGKVPDTVGEMVLMT